MNLLFFLIQVFIISCSGAMQPGPVTATVISMGARNRFAGILLTIGHVIIELPLIILITLGMGTILKSKNTQIVIGLAGGIILVIMAIRMATTLKNNKSSNTKALKNNPLLAGAILSASNPYFLLWWATVGLALATTARGFGIWGFALFAAVHWLCDLIWLQALSWASFKGTALLGRRSEVAAISICAGLVFLFGLFFMIKAIAALI